MFEGNEIDVLRLGRVKVHHHDGAPPLHARGTRGAAAGAADVPGPRLFGPNMLWEAEEMQNPEV